MWTKIKRHVNEGNMYGVEQGKNIGKLTDPKQAVEVLNSLDKSIPIGIRMDVSIEVNGKKREGQMWHKLDGSGNFVKCNAGETSSCGQV